MPQSKANTPRRSRKPGLVKSKPNRQGKSGPRYSVGLPSAVASQVERYAETVDASMSKAIAALVRLGLESYAHRKHEFLRRLTGKLPEADANEQVRVVEEFRTQTLGRRMCRKASGSGSQGSSGPTGGTARGSVAFGK